MPDFHCHYSLLSPQIQHRVANRKIFSGRPFAVKGDLKLGRHESASSCWTKTYSFLASNLKKSRTVMQLSIHFNCDRI